jgi:signal transduction histidine kinase
MPDSYFVVNTDLELIDFNKSFLDKIMTNKELVKSELIVENMKNSILNQKNYDALVKAIQNVIETNRFCSFEQKIEKLSKIFNIDINPITSDGQVIGAIVLFKDITELKQTQNILVEKERLFTLGELAGGMAHDINTPLSSIATGVSYIEETMTLNDDSKEIVDAMRRSIEKISNIVNSIRDQIRNTGMDKNEEFAINTLVKNVEMLLFSEIKKSNCEIKFSAKEEIRLKGDTNKLEQVITNIVLNAVQAYEGRRGIVDIELYKSEDKAIIKITDSAGGIPEKIAEGLLNQILTTKGSRGTGFGLYFSNSIIKGIFNGNLRFETKLGEGTTFYIEIPVNI